MNSLVLIGTLEPNKKRVAYGKLPLALWVPLKISGAVGLRGMTNTSFKIC